MNTYFYFGIVVGAKSGEFLGRVQALDLDTFNGIILQEYYGQYNFYVTAKIRVDFGELSEKKICEILNKYGYDPLEPIFPNFKETLNKVYEDDPSLLRFYEKDFKNKSGKEFIEGVKEYRKNNRFNICAVIAGVKN